MIDMFIYIQSYLANDVPIPVIRNATHVSGIFAHFGNNVTKSLFCCIHFLVVKLFRLHNLICLKTYILPATPYASSPRSHVKLYIDLPAFSASIPIYVYSNSKKLCQYALRISLPRCTSTCSQPRILLT